MYIEKGFLLVGGISAAFLIVAVFLAFIYLKKSYEKVQKDYKRVKIMLDMAPLCCQLWDEELHIIDCNQAAIDLYGFSDKKSHMFNFFKCFPETQPDGSPSLEVARGKFKRAFQGERISFDWVHQLLDGTPVPSRVTLVRVEYKDDYAVVAYVADMRGHNKMLEEIKRAEIAEERNKAKTRFLAQMSHELRTPLNSVMGFSELALDSDNLPKVKDYLGKILENAKWLLNVINEILDTSKIEQGKIELGHAPFKLYDVIARCQSVILPSANKKHIELSVYAEPLMGKKLVGDPVRLSQALMNLLTNAVKFTEEGKIKLSSVVKNVDENSATMYFEVSDTGIGMSAAQTASVFDAFSQADMGSTRKFDGPGLGLTIANSIIRQMGGRLSVASAPGAGSIFSFEITFEIVDSAYDGHAGSSPEEVDEKPYFDGLVLICDDNDMNLQVICDHLSSLGVQSVTAHNGKIGVEKVKERMQNNEPPFDLIFVDIFMPVMDGLEAVAKIKELGCKTPLVALTANIMEGEIERYKQNGINECLGKPFSAQELWRCLLKHLKQVEPPMLLAEYESGKPAVSSLPVQTPPDLTKTLNVEFIKNNKTRFKDITDAISAGDTKTAHRLAHSLKGNAGFIARLKLQELAQNVESLLHNGETVPAPLLSLLESELIKTLDELNEITGGESSEVSENVHIELDEEKTRELFAKLAEMFDNLDPGCIELLDQLRTVPDTEELASCIERFELKEAREILDGMSKKVIAVH